MLREVGLSVEELNKLLNLEFEQSSEPEVKEIFNNEGKKIEDIVERRIATKGGEAQVLDVRLYESVVRGKDDMSLHLKTGEKRGFEVILVLEGEATLDFPDAVEPMGTGLYVASRGRTSVNLRLGMLAIIPAPVANAWSKVGDNFRFRYICQHPWTREIVKSVLF